MLSIASSDSIPAELTRGSKSGPERSSQSRKSAPPPPLARLGEAPKRPGTVKSKGGAPTELLLARTTLSP